MRARLKHDLAPHLPPPKPGRPILTGLAGLSAFVAAAEPEIAANAMLCAINQAAYLLKRQLEAQGREFTEKGGFTERLHATRVAARAAQAAPAGAPSCPTCGKLMRRRTAAKGPRAGQPFWGCSGYPDCRTILNLEPTP